MKIIPSSFLLSFSFSLFLPMGSQAEECQNFPPQCIEVLQSPINVGRVDFANNRSVESQYNIRFGWMFDELTSCNANSCRSLAKCTKPDGCDLTYIERFEGSRTREFVLKYIAAARLYWDHPILHSQQETYGFSGRGLYRQCAEPNADSCQGAWQEVKFDMYIRDSGFQCGLRSTNTVDTFKFKITHLITNAVIFDSNLIGLGQPDITGDFDTEFRDDCKFVLTKDDYDTLNKE